MDRTFTRFGLTLMVNHACNLRCTYCYTGAKFHSPMKTEVGETAIARALDELAPDGTLALGFFGGEPLLESAPILNWMDYARSRSAMEGKHVQFSLTTNGTYSEGDAWRVMTAIDLDVTVSFDGHPRIHDRHRRTVQGTGSAGLVEATLRKLIAHGKALRVNVVVRPDGLEDLAEGMDFLHALGIRQVNLSLDLWTQWNFQDGLRLETFVERAARQWREWLPDFS